MPRPPYTRLTLYAEKTARLSPSILILSPADSVKLYQPYSNNSLNGSFA